MNTELIFITPNNLPEGHYDSLSEYLSKRLFDLGHKTVFESHLEVNFEKVKNSILKAVSRSELIFIIGGVESELGSIAKTALARALNLSLVRDEVQFNTVLEYCDKLGIVPSEEHLAAAVSLSGAESIKNDSGICCGLSLNTADNRIILLPIDAKVLKPMFENYVVPTLKNTDRDNSIEEIVNTLIEKGITVSTAESCTAGMLSEAITSISGSSAVFEYGISAYSNRIKTEILKVPADIIETYSAISSETAVEMAKKVRNISNSAIGVSITGNAGPSPSEGKPVGTVFIALADKNGYMISALSLPCESGRDRIRHAAVSNALTLIKEYSDAYPTRLAAMTPFETVMEAENPAEIKAENPDYANYLVFDCEEDSVILENSAFEEQFAIKTRISYLRTSAADAIKRIFKFNLSKKDSVNDDVAKVNDETVAVDDTPVLNKKISLKETLTKFLAFIKNVIPLKNDGTKRIFIKSAFLVSLVSLIVCAAVICTQLFADGKERSIIENARQQWYFDGNRNEDNVFTSTIPFTEQNKDFRAWITIADTEVNNPVYQTDNNDYYINHNMNKEESRYGALFFDYRCSLLSEAPSQNLTIYGHDMKDGSMFGSLKKYKRLSSYHSSPTISLTTLTENQSYRIFAIMVTNSKASDDNGYLYNYTLPNFETQEDFINWTDEARERSIINTPVNVIANDRILTLVTCINDFPDARLVIMARMVRPGESVVFSASSATLNTNPRYPQAWYDSKGLEGYKPSIPSQPDNSVSRPNGSNTDNSSSDNVSSDNASSDNASSDNASSDDASSDDVSFDDASSDDVSSDDVSSDDASSDNASSDDASSDDASSDDASSDDVSSDDVSSDDVSSDDVSSDDASSDTQNNSDSQSAE